MSDFQETYFDHISMNIFSQNNFMRAEDADNIDEYEGEAPDAEGPELEEEFSLG